MWWGFAGRRGDLFRVIIMTGMLSRCRVVCDSRRKSYFSEYFTMYSFCGYFAGVLGSVSAEFRLRFGRGWVIIRLVRGRLVR